jgi:alpha-L-fucosidase
MRENGETIYNTTEGPLTPTDEIAFTQKGKTLFLHVLNDEKEVFFIKGFTAKISSIKYYKSNDKVAFTKNKYGLIIEIPKEKRDSIDTIIEMKLK